MHTLHRALGTARPEILARDGRRRTHQPHRRPCDEREQLAVAYRIGGLRLRALGQ